MAPSKNVSSELQRALRDLPRVEGRGAVVALVTGHGGVWELTWAGAGLLPASLAGLATLAQAWSVTLAREGFQAALPPRVFPGAEVPTAPDALVLATPQGQVHARRFTPDSGAEPLQACRAIQTVREDSEQAVLRLGSGLQEVLSTARGQCDDMAEVVRQLEGGDATSLDTTLHALEGEVLSLGSELQARLASQRQAAEGASGWASDIIHLAETVDQIAQSARLLTFNARLESARLGEQGRGFVVIANAIRDLATEVRTSNEVVTRLATSLASALPSLQRGTAELARDVDGRLEQLRARLESVRTSFESTRQQTLEGLRSSEAAARRLRDRSHGVVEDLQFQDRASQLLRHAGDQVARLEQSLGLVEAAPDDLLSRVGELGRTLEGTAALAPPSSVELF